MKKLLLLSAVLAVGTSLFATGGYHRPVCPGVDAYVPVTAEICYPLQITLIKPLEFHKVNAYVGKYVDPYGFGHGRINVTGMKEKFVNVEFDETVVLTRLGGGDTLDVNPVFMREDPGKTYTSDFQMKINDQGWMGLNYLGLERIFIGGKIEPQLVEPGDYAGLLTVSFTYAE